MEKGDKPAFGSATPGDETPDERVPPFELYPDESEDTCGDDYTDFPPTYAVVSRV